MPSPLEATIDIHATPEQVWGVLGDLARMQELSPTTLKMQPLGAPKAGTWTVNLNKVGWKYYPTTAKILAYEPNRQLSFRMNENTTIWSFTLEAIENGTRVVERRDIPTGVAKPVQVLIEKFLGGEQRFEADLVLGMNETLGRLKAAAER
ncbi:SRPBCC family protein [Nocardia stercoris]|uniref:SRPBCC family protein n=1 Tax=Nocardia stercoris TaxID=2483361 RepID=A0A3M2LBC6_9NOCA|nr:SRPBCC family protein [Nocardia stercoris]RMI34366.1 SRPBCC family protein [Nocardia stercoris]